MNCGDRVWFVDETRPYTVQAVSPSGRYVALTKPFAARKTVLYTVADLEHCCRGVDNSIGNSLGYETGVECQAAMRLFDSGEYGFSRRHPPVPLIVRKLVPAGKSKMSRPGR